MSRHTASTAIESMAGKHRKVGDISSEVIEYYEVQDRSTRHVNKTAFKLEQDNTEVSLLNCAILIVTFL